MKRLGKYGVIVRVSLQNAIAYRSNVLTGLGFYTLFVYVFMCLWRAIYQGGEMDGYTYPQIVWYLLMTELMGFGTGYAIYHAMNEEVKSGSIGYLIGRPTHYVFYHLANSVGQILFNVVCYGLLSIILGLWFVGPVPGFGFIRLLPVLLSMLLGMLINYFCLMSIGLSAFILEDNYALFLIYQKLLFMLGMFLPVEFLPGWLQPVALALPFAYGTWAPAKLLVDYSPELFLQLLPRQLAWAAAAMGMALLCYRAVARRLQVNGG